MINILWRSNYIQSLPHMGFASGISPHCIHGWLSPPSWLPPEVVLVRRLSSIVRPRKGGKRQEIWSGPPSSTLGQISYVNIVDSRSSVNMSYAVVWICCCLLKFLSENFHKLAQDLWDVVFFVNGPPGSRNSNIRLLGSHKISKSSRQDLWLFRSCSWPSFFICWDCFLFLKVGDKHFNLKKKVILLNCLLSLSLEFLKIFYRTSNWHGFWLVCSTLWQTSVVMASAAMSAVSLRVFLRLRRQLSLAFSSKWTTGKQHKCRALQR